MDFRIEPNADPLLAQAVEQANGWSRPFGEIRRRMEAGPGVHRVARDAQGRALGIVSLMRHGEELAWVGGMVVIPEARAQGVGRALLDEALAHARRAGVRTVGLDATESGRRLYERAGFRPVGPVPRWRRREGTQIPDPPASAYAVYPISSCEIMDLARYDRPRFGANRIPFLADVLARFPERSFVAFHRATGEIGGYALGKERAVGPLVADAPEAALSLLRACELAGTPPTLVLDAPRPEVEAALRGFGYEPEGVSCTRMILGDGLPGVRGALWAADSWMLG